MFGSQALETAIGLAAMFFIVATAASSITEFTSRLFNKRAKGLEKSVAAVYPMRRFLEIPDELRRRFVLLGVRERRGQFRIAPEVRACVRFARVNLMAHAAGNLGSFDLVLCRNVMIYFRAETRRKVVAWLCSNVAEGGYLWAGHSESLHDLDPRLRTVVPTVYRVLQEGEA